MSNRWDVFDVAFVGTSLTWSLTREDGYWQSFLHRTLQPQVSRPLRFYDFGVSGDTSAGMLARIGTPAGMRPRLAVIEVGMNDANTSVALATFASNVTSIINAFKTSDASTKIALMTMNPAISPASGTLVSNLPSYYQKLRDLSTSEGVYLFDNTASWGTPNTTQIPDGVHPTVAAVRATMVPNLVTDIGGLVT